MRTQTPQEIAAAEQRMAEAKAKYSEPWWDSQDHATLFWGQLNEDILLVPFSRFHEAAEKALGRPVWTHEFAGRQSLVDEFMERTPKATFADVLAKIPTGKAVVVTSGEASANDPSSATRPTKRPE